jgi:hypothetical protein
MKLLTPLLIVLASSATTSAAPTTSPVTKDNCPEACSSRYELCMADFPPEYVKPCQFNVCMWWKEKKSVSHTAYLITPLYPSKVPPFSFQSPIYISSMEVEKE